MRGVWGRAFFLVVDGGFVLLVAVEAGKELEFDMERWLEFLMVGKG